MAILIDPPMWPAHGRLWSHLISDSSFEELHAFARAHGVPARGFEGDHYDVPQERYPQLVAAGAHPVAGRELLLRLRLAGLRRPKRRGERVLASHDDGGRRVDVLASALTPPWPVRVVWALVGGPAGVLAVPTAQPQPPGWTLPWLAGSPSATPADLAARAVQPLTGADDGVRPGDWRQVGYLRGDHGTVAAGAPAAAGTVVEVLLRRDDVTPGQTLPRLPARWVDPADVSRGTPRLAPLLDVVLAVPTDA